MQPGEKSGVSQERWSIGKPRIVEDWEAAHIFLEVARSGSFRSASQSLGQSVNALRRKVDEFEHALGAPLLTRHVNGVRLTQEGTDVYEAALGMEKASFSLLQAHDRSEKKNEGEVRIATTEGLGTFWMVPRLVRFQLDYPKLVVNLTSTMKSADVLRLEADIAVQLHRPQSSDLKVTKLGRLHLMFFAAQSYLDKHGTPATPADFPQHRFVMLRDDNTQWGNLEQKFFPGISPTGLVSLRTNSSVAHFWAVARGVGIGILPTYARPISPIGADLVALGIGIHHPVDIWLTYHPDAERIARVRTAIDWIVQSFDPRKFPWFRDEFIHPEQLGEIYKGDPLAAFGASG